MGGEVGGRELAGGVRWSDCLTVTNAFTPPELAQNTLHKSFFFTVLLSTKTWSNRLFFIIFVYFDFNNKNHLLCQIDPMKGTMLHSSEPTLQDT